MADVAKPAELTRAVDQLQRALQSAVDQKHPKATHKQLAHHVGVSSAVIQNVLAGIPKAYGLDTLLKLARYIDRPLDEILGLSTTDDDRLRRVLREEFAAAQEQKQSSRPPPSRTGEFQSSPPRAARKTDKK
jgi:transcriptional regulator with XRE-family HTH domain